MESEENALKSYCRLCAKIKQVGKLIDIQQIIPNLKRLNQPFVALENTSLPQRACLVCVQSLDVCIQFIDNVEKAHNSLIKLLPKNCVFMVQSEPCTNDIKEELPTSDRSFVKPEVTIEIEKTDETICLTKNTSTSSESDDNDFKGDTSTSKKKSKINIKRVKTDRKIYESNSEDEDDNNYANDRTNTATSKSLKMVESWDKLEWACYLCDCMFPSQALLVEHSMSTHNNCTTYKCMVCVKRFLKLETYIFHVRKFHSTKLRMSCHICFKVFKSMRARKRHQDTHIPEPFTCTGCSLTFPTEDEFNAHVVSYYITRYDKNIKQLNIDALCNICNEKFDSMFKLKKHLASTHRPKQPHICDQCGKKFLHNAHLAIHMLIHNNIKGFKCSICPASFKLPSGLNQHMIRHKGEKKHSCPECGKCFLFKNQLTTHLTTHSSEFPYKCEYCVKCFRLSGQLKRHLRQHTGYKPYKCHICEREFTDWPNYNKHMVRKHQIDTSKTKRTPHGVIRLANVVQTEAQN